MYCVDELEINPAKRRQILFYFLWYIGYSFLHLLLLLLPVLFPFTFFLAGPRCLTLDFSFVICLSILVMYSCFGVLNMGMDAGYIVGCFLISPFLVLVGSPLIDSMIRLKALWSILKEWKSGSVMYEVTPKSTKDLVSKKQG